LVACPAYAVAEEPQYNTAGDLYRAWYDNMPDYVCGVWSTDGGMDNLTYAVQDTKAGNAGKDEILSLIRDDTTVSFVYQKYSRNRLMQIQDELFEYMSLESGLIITALNEMDNCVDIGIYKEKKDSPETIEMLKNLNKKYGDAIRIEYVGLIHTYDDVNFVDVTADSGVNSVVKFLVFVIVVLAVMLVASVWFIFRKRRYFVIQATNGENIASDAQPTAREVENMVRKTTLSPPENMYEKIIEKISNNR